MPAKKKEKEDIEETENPSIRIMSSLLKNNKDDHFNFEETICYKLKTSSLTMNQEINFEPGVHRVTGVSSGGKTSICLDLMRHFLEDTSKTERRGVFFKAEGRLSGNTKLRSFVKFVENVEDWENGTCLIVSSGIQEFIFDTIRDLITGKNNPNNCRYMFVIDSLDMVIKREDYLKSSGESQMVASAAGLTSTFFKKVSLALSTRGHFLFLVSQIRDNLKVDRYEKTSPRITQASGGHAAVHQSGWILEVLPRYQDDYIREGDTKTGRILGHYAKIRVNKSDTESYQHEFKYPIRHQAPPGQSVWVSREYTEQALSWGIITRSGAWYYFESSIYEEMIASGFNIQEKYQGLNSLYELFENNSELLNFLAAKLKNLA